MPHRRATALLSLISLAALLGACSGGNPLGGPVGPNPQVPPPGPAGFRDGYVDGCLTGFGDAGRDGYQTAARQDARRYASDAEYKRGFDQGRAACYEEERRHPKMLPSDPGV